MANSEISSPPPQLKGEMNNTPEISQNTTSVEPEAAPTPVTIPTVSQSAHAPISKVSTMSTLTPSSSRTSSPTIETTPSPSHKAPHNISNAISKDNIILELHTRKYSHPNSTHVTYALPANHIIDPIANDPLTVEEAKSQPDWPQWKQAMDDEMEQLRKLGTFSHTPLPADRTAVASKWVFRVKHDKLGKPGSLPKASPRFQVLTRTKPLPPLSTWKQPTYFLPLPRDTNSKFTLLV
jgi:hypothetical protein